MFPLPDSGSLPIDWQPERHYSVETPVRRVFPSETRKEKTLLLDVRTPAEFEEAHIEGSALHPLSKLDPEEVAKLAAGKDGCILFLPQRQSRAPGGGETQSKGTRLALHPRRWPAGVGSAGIAA